MPSPFIVGGSFARVFYVYEVLSPSISTREQTSNEKGPFLSNNLFPKIPKNKYTMECSSLALLRAVAFGRTRNIGLTSDHARRIYDVSATTVTKTVITRNVKYPLDDWGVFRRD